MKKGQYTDKILVVSDTHALVKHGGSLVFTHSALPQGTEFERCDYFIEGCSLTVALITGTVFKNIPVDTVEIALLGFNPEGKGGVAL
jgi:hypothetical protein